MSVAPCTHAKHEKCSGPLQTKALMIRAATRYRLVADLDYHVDHVSSLLGCTLR